MALFKLQDFNPDYLDALGGQEIKGLEVYTQKKEKVGTVSDALVDAAGHFRYFVVDTGFWIFGKKILLPIGRSQMSSGRLYLRGLSKAQAEDLPEYHEDMTVDPQYEERVRRVYRSAPLETEVPLEASGQLESPIPLINHAQTISHLDQLTPSTRVEQPAPTRVDQQAIEHRTSEPVSLPIYNYQQEPELYHVNDHDHPVLRLYEERLVANKHRVKSGEVEVRKQVETHLARVSVPIKRERVVIERLPQTSASAHSIPMTTQLESSQVLRVELYEEVPEIQREVVVRETVQLKKIVEQDLTHIEEPLRYEELEIKETTPSATLNAALNSESKPFSHS